jgi:curli biogenesis system outer membrane secretion channel CsgG
MKMMKKFVWFVMLVALANLNCALVVNRKQLHANTAIKFPPPTELKIGVLPLLSPTPGESKYAGYWGGKGTIKTLENSGQIVADAITSALVGVKNVTLIERAQLEKILTEHELTMNGIINQPDFRVLGEILPVDALIFGTVSACYNWNETANWGAIVAFNARLVDVHTGKILFTLIGAMNEHNAAPEEMAYRVATDAIQELIRRSK